MSLYSLGYIKISPAVVRITDRTQYWLSVTFKFIQGRWFSFYLKANMRLYIND